MKKFLIICIFGLTTLVASVIDEEIAVQRLYATFTSKEIVVLLDKKTNKHIKTLDVRNFFPFRKIGNHWIAQVQTKDKKWGFMNVDGSWLVEPNLDEAKSFSEDNVTRVKKDGKWFFLKSDGKPLLQSSYNYVSPFREGLAVVQDKDDELFYYINLKGQKVFKKSFSAARVFAKNGLAAVAITDNTISLFDVTLKSVIKSKIEGKLLWGFMNKDGRMVIKAQFPRVNSFNDFNLSSVYDKGGNNRLIKMNGKYINNKSYEYLWGFSASGVAWSKSLGKDSFTGYIDVNGKEVWKASYHDFSGEHNGLLVNERDGFQVFDPFGKLVIKEKSTWLDTFSDANVSVALRHGKWGILTKYGVFKAFSKDIIAPLTTSENWVIGFVDGLLPMINEKREIVYFDRDGVLKYSFKNNDNNMTLYDNKAKIIWKSDIEKGKAYPFLARGVEEFFNDTNDYREEGIYKTVGKLLKSDAKKYHIPNFLYSDSSDPYKLSGDEESTKQGAIKILASGYVGENEWGSYYFLNEEGAEFYKYKQRLEEFISKKYGQPLEQSSSKVSWKISNKVLNLEIFSDYGDGDFYHMLVLEVEEK